MSSHFEHLFSPLGVGSYTLANRIMNTGHAAHYQTGDGIPTERYVDYVRERARGGAGIIVTGHTVPYYDGDASLSLASFDERIVEAYARMAAATHQFDVPLLAQLGHRGRRISDAAGFISRPTLAPSAVPAPDLSVPMLVPHAMSVAEIAQVVEQLAAAADRARRGDLDGVELSVGMDYLFTNFLSAQANRRDDRYGGASVVQRMTFLRECIAAVRSALGSDRLLGIRFYDDQEDYSLRLAEYREVAHQLEADGQVDYFNMWQGIVPSPRSGRSHWPSHHDAPGAFAGLAQGLKDHVNLPVVGTGRIESPALADRFVADGVADLVGMVRALIADPHFPNKARRGRAEDIRTCIGCTQSCVGHVYLGLGVGCIYNPVTGREAEWADVEPAEVARTVVVVGGGPAGLEVARVAAERGHRVVLFERARRLGGQVNLAMRTPGRESFESIIGYFETQLAKLGVDLRLGQEATPEQILAEHADAVVIATGSHAWRPELEGAWRANVLTAREVLADRGENAQRIGSRVLVVDAHGRAEGVTVAEYLAERGHRVEVVTGLAYVGREMSPPAWHRHIENLLRSEVVLTPFTGVWEIGESSVELYNVISWQPRTIEGIDTVVFAAGGVAADDLYRALHGKVSELHCIGDAYQARDIEVAVVEGHRLGRAV